MSLAQYHADLHFLVRDVQQGKAVRLPFTFGTDRRFPSGSTYDQRPWWHRLNRSARFSNIVILSRTRRRISACRGALDFRDLGWSRGARFSRSFTALRSVQDDPVRPPCCSSIVAAHLVRSARAATGLTRVFPPTVFRGERPLRASNERWMRRTTVFRR